MLFTVTSRIQGSHFIVLIIGITAIYFQNVYPWKVDATYKLLLWILCSFMKASGVHISGYRKWQSRGVWAAWYLGGNNSASLSLGDINMESWFSRIGVGHETDNLILCKDNCWELSKTRAKVCSVPLVMMMMKLQRKKL